MTTSKGVTLLLEAGDSCLCSCWQAD
ncbi:hypothetical protein FQN60_007337 [Etheostoma spectabile]|uniref:Uncharacterized protein n=1 Tax=Etheostoma spectabile TaxID=54343 RepID=A0A5J5CC07_9PERO|nr:hypothetical protein FQN60_007337 [Etheostoma spectabile]